MTKVEMYKEGLRKLLALPVDEQAKLLPEIVELRARYETLNMLSLYSTLVPGKAKAERLVYWEQFAAYCLALKDAYIYPAEQKTGPEFEESLKTMEKNFTEITQNLFDGLMKIIDSNRKEETLAAQIKECAKGVSVLYIALRELIFPLNQRVNELIKAAA